MRRRDRRPVKSAAPAAGRRFGRRVAIGGGRPLAAGGAGRPGSSLGWRARGSPAAGALYAQGVEPCGSDRPSRPLRRSASCARRWPRRLISRMPCGMVAIAYQANAEFVPPEAARLSGERGRSAARRSLELDPGNVNALAAGRWRSRSTAIGHHARPHPASPCDGPATNRDARPVVADPGRSRPYQRGDRDDRRGRRAASDDAASSISAGLDALERGRIEDSDRVFERAMQLWRRNYAVWFSRLWTYAYTGRGSQALALLADLSRRPIGIPDWNWEMVEAAARALTTRLPGDVHAAIAMTRRLAPRGIGFCENAIQVAAALGRNDDAFGVADAYYLGGASPSSSYFSPQGVYVQPPSRRTDFLFIPSRRSVRTRVGPMIAEIGLTDYWRRTGTRPSTFSPEAGAGPFLRHRLRRAEMLKEVILGERDALGAQDGVGHGRVEEEIGQGEAGQIGPAGETDSRRGKGSRPRDPRCRRAERRRYSR